MTLEELLFSQAYQCLRDPDLQLVLKELRLAGARVSTLVGPTMFSGQPNGKLPITHSVRFVTVGMNYHSHELSVTERGFWVWRDTVAFWEVPTEDVEENLGEALDFFLEKIRERID
jgi:hypothetical protein